jgi:hypothetical protein
MDDNFVYGFNKPDADQILRQAGLQRPVPSEQSTYDATALMVGYTSAGATARSGTTLGKGTFVLYWPKVSGTDRILTASTNTTAVTVYNLSTTAVAATKYIMVLRWGDIWVCNWEEC